MNFKPFYIKYEKWMTYTQVAEVFDKAVMLGAIMMEGVDSHHEAGCKACCYCPDHFMFFGVDLWGDTYFSDSFGGYGENAVCITLDQVDEHLGLTSKEDNGRINLQQSKGTNPDLCNTAVRVFDGSGHLNAYGYMAACVNDGISVTDNTPWYSYEYLEVSTGEHGYILKPCNALKPETKLINFKYNLTWEIEPMETSETREIVVIGGEEYYADAVPAMLDAIAAAKVSGGVIPQAGSGTPPDEK